MDSSDCVIKAAILNFFLWKKKKKLKSQKHEKLVSLSHPNSQLQVHINDYLLDVLLGTISL